MVDIHTSCTRTTMEPVADMLLAVFSGPDGARVRGLVSVGRRPLHAATVQDLERWADRVLDAQRLDEVFRDV